MSNIERRQQPNDDSFFEQQVQAAQECHDRGLDLCYAYPKNVDRALAELDEAIRMRESLLGKFHNDTALSYFRKASILREDKKDFFSALVVARRELRIAHKLLGGGKSELSILQANGKKKWLTERIQWIQEVLLQHQRQMTEADIAKYISQLLQILEYERIGDIHFARKEWDLAISQYDCALTMESSAYARNILEMADIQIKIGDCYAGMEEYDTAMEEYKNAQTKYRDQLGSSLHALSGHLLNKTAALFLKQKDFDAALGAYAKSYAIYEQVLGKQHELSVEALQDIRLVTVKEMEELRNAERLRQKQGMKDKPLVSKAQRGRKRIEVEDRSGAETF